jgi:hypothetical protein
VCACAFLILLLAMFESHAQGTRGKHREQDPAAQAKAAESKKKAKELDDAYRSSLRSIPDKPKTDPWGGMR